MRRLNESVLRSSKKDCRQIRTNMDRINGFFRVQTDPGKPGKMVFFEKSQGNSGKPREKK